MASGSSIFASLPRLEKCEKLRISEDFESDDDPKKICAFSNEARDENGNPFIFPVVQKCIKTIAGRDLSNVKGLLSFCDMEKYSQLSLEFLFGPSSNVVQQKRCLAVHTVSSSGALAIGTEFLRTQNYTNFLVEHPDVISDYTNIFRNAGFLKEFRYRQPEISSRVGRYKNMISDLEKAPPRCVIVFKMCGLDSTGLDPTTSEWEAIAEIIKRKEMFPFFDAAYHGLVSGDPDLDAWSVRYFAERNIEFFVAQSFSLNMGLFLERPSNLILVQKTTIISEDLKNYLYAITRNSICNAPAFGPLIVRSILGNRELKSMFLDNLRGIVSKNQRMRETIISALNKIKGGLDDQRGLFLDLELHPKQISYLATEHHIYLPAYGRISLISLNDKNIHHFCKGLVSALNLAKDKDEFKLTSKSSIDVNSVPNIALKKKRVKVKYHLDKE